MNKILNLRIYTPEKLAIDEVIKKISLNGREGSYTILPNHIDYLSSFGNSMVNFIKDDGEKIYLRLNQGILVKCGREIQISTFGISEIGENNTENELEEKLKNTLKNIGRSIFKKNNRKAL